MNLALSVTEVRNALRCPRIFTLGRMLGRQVSFPVTASSLGAAFHRIVGAFSATAASTSPRLSRLQEGASEEAIARALMGLVLDSAADEIARTPSYASMPAEVDDLAEALRELSRYIARELTGLGGRPADALLHFLGQSELDVDDTIDIGDGAVVLLNGRLDALHQRAGSSVDLVEYKLTPESNDALDRAQVALYRYLLRETFSIEADPVVLRFQPKLSVTRLTAEAADALVEERLLPLVRNMAGWAAGTADVPGTEQSDLCPSCPVRAACAATYPDYLACRDQPPAGARRPLPDENGNSILPAAPAVGSSTSAAEEDSAGREEADKLRTAIERSYRSQGVGASAGDAKIGPTIISFEVRAQRGSIKKVDQGADDVVHRLEAELGAHANYRRDGGLRRLEVARRVPRKVLLKSLLERDEAYLRDKPGRFVVGEDVSGNVLHGDLFDPSACHILVGGATGSGKSVLLRALIASLAHFHAPDEIRFTLIDPKRVSFTRFRTTLGAHLAHPICYEVEQAIEILEGLVHEMEERYQAFEASGCEDLDAYNEESTRERFARHVVVVDEFADLLALKAHREAFLNVVQRLCAKARAAGIHLVLATQRPDAKTVPGVIKTNLVGRIALRVPDAVASRIMIDQAGAERLLGRGDLYANFGHGAVRAQAAFLEGG